MANILYGQVWYSGGVQHPMRVQEWSMYSQGWRDGNDHAQYVTVWGDLLGVQIVKYKVGS
ncbi:unnamed protein product [Staurois parvus]|uniref:Uncharacterized protein n=1 Tax=Staurois parvus TaxID=386267 RepID=A0ABN9BIF1_9NEOB|nr:unnamed protein product [Staurois parvus]